MGGAVSIGDSVLKNPQRAIVSVCIGILAAILFLALSGCDREEGAVSVGATTSQASGDTSGTAGGIKVWVYPETSDPGIKVWVDPETGCQYLLSPGRYEAGITPRMNRGNGFYQVGCRDDIKFRNPVTGK